MNDLYFQVYCSVFLAVRVFGSNFSANSTTITNASNTTELPAAAMGKLVDRLTSDKVYNKNIRPYYGEKPTKVTIGILVNDIYSVSENDMDFTIDFLFRQYWHDPRLAFKPINNLTDELILGEDFAKLIWLHDTYIRNSKSLTTHMSTSKQSSTMIRVKPSGTVSYSARLTTTANCPMDLKYFPGDKQNCKLVLASYNPTKDIVHYWATGVDAYILNSSSVLPMLTLTSHRTYKTKVSFTYGIYTRLVFEMRFERSLGYYLDQIYIPSFLIVVISWIPFWLDRNDNHARVGLGVTTVLTITTLITSTNESLPKVSYIKAIDIYLIVCFLMVFLSLIEFATIGWFESMEQSSSTETWKNHAIDTFDDKLKPKATKNMNTAWIDRVSRLAFPAVFITFNVLYVGFFIFVID